MGRTGRRLQSFRRFDVPTTSAVQSGHGRPCVGMLGRGEAAGGDAHPGRRHGVRILPLMLAQRHSTLWSRRWSSSRRRSASAENVTASLFSTRISVHEKAVQAWGGADVDLVVQPSFFTTIPKAPSANEFGTARRHAPCGCSSLRPTGDPQSFQFVFPTEKGEEVGPPAPRRGRLSERISPLERRP